MELCDDDEGDRVESVFECLSLRAGQRPRKLLRNSRLSETMCRFGIHDGRWTVGPPRLTCFSFFCPWTMDQHRFRDLGAIRSSVSAICAPVHTIVPQHSVVRGADLHFLLTVGWIVL